MSTHGRCSLYRSWLCNHALTCVKRLCSHWWAGCEHVFLWVTIEIILCSCNKEMAGTGSLEVVVQGFTIIPLASKCGGCRHCLLSKCPPWEGTHTDRMLPSGKGMPCFRGVGNRCENKTTIFVCHCRGHSIFCKPICETANYIVRI